MLICYEETENQSLFLTHEYIKSPVTQTGRVRQEGYSNLTAQPELRGEDEEIGGWEEGVPAVKHNLS